MKFQVWGNANGKSVFINSGIPYEVNWDINYHTYRINYAVDAAWCNFHLNNMNRETIKAVKLWQEATNKLTGWKCF